MTVITNSSINGNPPLTSAQAAAVAKSPSVVANDTSAALANTKAIQALLDTGGVVYLPPGLGNVFVSKTLKQSPYSSFITGAGTVLKRTGAKAFHIVRNLHGHGGAYVNGSTITGGLLTVGEPGHSWQVGQTVFCENFKGNATLNGPQTVVSVVEGVSWTFAASGANPTNLVGDVMFTSVYNPIAAASFTRTITSTTVTLALAASVAATTPASGAVISATNTFTSGQAVQFDSAAGGFLTGTTYYIQPSGLSGAAFQLGSYAPSTASTASTGAGSATVFASGVGSAVTWTAHGLKASTPVVFTTTGALPSPLVAGTVYYVSATGLDTDTFQVAGAPGGVPIAFYGSQSGTQTCATGSVVVAEAGHSRFSGDAIYIAGLTGDTTFNGPTLITDIVDGVSWTYLSAGASTAPTGTAQVLGDRQIDFCLEMDGNQANLTGAQWTSHLSMWTNCANVVGKIPNSVEIGPGRAAAFSNAVDVYMPTVYGRDRCNVLVQFDGLCDRVNIGIISSFKLGDDPLAWGVCDGRAGTTYADTSFPCTVVFGLASMGSLKVDEIHGKGVTSLFKMYCAAGFDLGNITIGKIVGAGALAIGDNSSATVSGGSFTSLTVGELACVPIDVTHPGFSLGNGCWGKCGSINIGILTDLTISPSQSVGGSYFSAGGPITVINIDTLRVPCSRTGGSTSVGVAPTLAGARLKIKSVDASCGGGGYVLLARGGATGCAVVMDSLQVDNWTQAGLTNTSGILVYSDGNCDWKHIQISNFKGYGFAAIISSATSGLTRYIQLSNVLVDTLGSGITGGAAGTWFIDLVNVNAGYGNGIGNRFLQFATAGQAIKCRAKNVTVANDRLILTGFTPTFQINGDSTTKVDFTAAGTQLVPVAGDILWNTNAAFGTGVGLYGYSNAAAWVKIF